MKLQKNDTELVGRWILRNDRFVADETCQRIEMLVTDQLEKLGTADEGWSTLFRDPEDGRLWELTYPESEIHGGGPPQLKLIKPDEARHKYVGFSE